MSISSINYANSLLGLSVQNLSNQLSNLSTELSTGVKSTNYAGMGVNEGFAIAARSQLANISAFSTTMTNVNTDINSANTVLSSLNAALTTLQSEASALGSNLSIVQIRQDFNKNLINVLQTGSSNLTLADTNEEAANSQALSTRQSIAVSALALANQSQSSVLQLLR